MAQKMKHIKGERLNIRFYRKIMLEFHGAKLTSDGGLLAYRELDDTLGLFESVSSVMNDRRTRFHDFKYRAASWKKLRRVVAKVEWHSGDLFPRVGFIITNMSAKAEGVVRFYNEHGIVEQWIKEGKYALNWTRLSCKHFLSNQVRLGLFILAYNLGNFLRRLVLPGKVKHWSLRRLLVKLIKIGAKVLRHSRYVIFQMAEVAISKEVFAEILSRISRLRCCSLQ